MAIEKSWVGIVHYFEGVWGFGRECWKANSDELSTRQPRINDRISGINYIDVEQAEIIIKRMMEVVK